MRLRFQLSALMSVSFVTLYGVPAHADGTPECNVRPGVVGSLECGADSVALRDFSTAIGQSAEVAGVADRGIAIGNGSSSRQEDGVAIGTSAHANPANRGAIVQVPVPDEIGGTTVGNFSRTQGTNSVALGGYSLVGTSRDGWGGVDQGTAIGAGAWVAEDKSTALGALATATGLNAVAIGANSDASEDNTVSFGTSGAERRLTNVSMGTANTDAVNYGQLLGVSAEAAGAQATANTALVNAATAQTSADNASAAAAAAQGTADTALANAATAQTSANNASTAAATAQGTANAALTHAATAQAVADNAKSIADVASVMGNEQGISVANTLGGGASYSSVTGRVTAPSYAVAGVSHNNVGSAIAALDSQMSNITYRLDDMAQGLRKDRKDMRRGIAAAIALTNAPFPSAPGRTAYAANSSIYRGEVGFSASVAHRLDVGTPFAITGGVSYAGGKNTAGRVGVAGEF